MSKKGSPQSTSSRLSRYLITTADERTWKYDRPVLFLGEWCKLYDRKSIWSKLDSLVAKPYGIEKIIKDRDYVYIYNLVDTLLVEVSILLNDYHKTNHSIRYWRILLGQWLHRCVSVVFNRWYALEQALDNYNISGTSILNDEQYSLATNDSYSFIWACNDNVWNHMLYAKILYYNKCVDFEKVSLCLNDKTNFTWNDVPNQPANHSFKSLVTDVVRSFLQKFSRNNDAVIIKSYLPKKEAIKLQLKLGQVPQFWDVPDADPNEIDLKLRKELSLKMYGNTDFEKFIRKIIISMVPACYLEGYSAMVKKADDLPWPNNPEFIFTSNSFDTDEIFKAWAGSKVEQGAKYYTGQHGNNYGTLKYCSSETELVATSDKFITWGWSDSRKNVIPAFNFKCPDQKNSHFRSDGGLLLIEVCSPHRLSPWDCYYEFGIYLNDQFRFVAALPSAIKDELTVRLHSAINLFQRSEKQMWCDEYSRVKLESGKENINKLISQSRIVVHSYDSTGILETLSMNIPTICFWQNGIEHLNTNAIPYYEDLREVGIIADTPEHAAKLVGYYWDDIDAWWKSNRVQLARQNFCDNFSRFEIKPANHIKRILCKQT